METAVAGAGADALALLHAGQPVESAVASLLNDLAEVDNDIIIVLDDYHAIDSAQIHEAIAFTVEHLPHHVHLVLGTRADPGTGDRHGEVSEPSGLAGSRAVRPPGQTLDAARSSACR